MHSTCAGGRVGFLLIPWSLVALAFTGACSKDEPRTVTSPTGQGGLVVEAGASAAGGSPGSDDSGGIAEPGTGDFASMNCVANAGAGPNGEPTCGPLECGPPHDTRADFEQRYHCQADTSPSWVRRLSGCGLISYDLNSFGTYSSFTVFDATNDELVATGECADVGGCQFHGQCALACLVSGTDYCSRFGLERPSCPEEVTEYCLPISNTVDAGTASTASTANGPIEDGG
jgi:hypothetical protein